MSTAVLLSGHTRSFARCLPTQQWHVFRKLEDPYFFCSVVDDDQANDIYLLEGLYPDRVFVERVTQPTLNIPGTNTVATDNLIQSQRHQLAQHAPYAVSASLQAILRQLWHLERVWDFASGIIKEKNLEPATYVRIRPDLWFSELHLPKAIGMKESHYAAWLPWWSRCGGVNDRFGIMGPRGAQGYFYAFAYAHSILALGCPLHPESIVAASLVVESVDVHNTLLASFRTLRMDGSTVPPVIYPGEQEAFFAATR
jgi:hypothetical protein